MAQFLIGSADNRKCINDLRAYIHKLTEEKQEAFGRIYGTPTATTVHLDAPTPLNLNEDNLASSGGKISSRADLIKNPPSILGVEDETILEGPEPSPSEEEDEDDDVSDRYRIDLEPTSPVSATSNCGTPPENLITSIRQPRALPLDSTENRAPSLSPGHKARNSSSSSSDDRVAVEETKDKDASDDTGSEGFGLDDIDLPGESEIDTDGDDDEETIRDLQLSLLDVLDGVHQDYF